MHRSNGTTEGSKRWQAVTTPPSKSTMMRCLIERATFNGGLERRGWGEGREMDGHSEMKSKSEHNIEGCGAAGT
jgi:hypothetical protein